MEEFKKKRREARLCIDCKVPLLGDEFDYCAECQEDWHSQHSYKSVGHSEFYLMNDWADEREVRVEGFILGD